jgi:hypothetical protein
MILVRFCSYDECVLGYIWNIVKLCIIINLIICDAEKSFNNVV